MVDPARWLRGWRGQQALTSGKPSPLGLGLPRSAGVESRPEWLGPLPGPAV